MDQAEENIEALLRGYDYLWCIYIDIDGNGRGKIFPKRSAAKHLRDGFGMAAGKNQGHGFTLIPAWISNHMPHRICWSLGIDK